MTTEIATTIRKSTRGQAVVAVLLALAGLAVGVMPLLTEVPPASREVVIVAKDMAFYVDGGAEPNPTIRVEAGETVRLTLRNEQPGVSHNFVVDAWQVATDRLVGAGRDTIVFSVPETTGRYAYECSPHSAMMLGTIEVLDARSARR